MAEEDLKQTRQDRLSHVTLAEAWQQVNLAKHSHRFLHNQARAWRRFALLNRCLPCAISPPLNQFRERSGRGRIQKSASPRGWCGSGPLRPARPFLQLLRRLAFSCDLPFGSVFSFSCSPCLSSCAGGLLSSCYIGSRSGLLHFAWMVGCNANGLVCGCKCCTAERLVSIVVMRLPQVGAGAEIGYQKSLPKRKREVHFLLKNWSVTHDYFEFFWHSAPAKAPRLQYDPCLTRFIFTGP